MVVVLSYLNPAILWQADNINNCKLKVNLQVGPALGRLGSTIIGVGRKNRPNANYRWSSWVWELNRLKFKIFRDNYLQMNLVNIPQISKESRTDRSQHASQISPGIHTGWVARSRDEKLKTPPGTSLGPTITITECIYERGRWNGWLQVKEVINPRRQREGDRS